MEVGEDILLGVFHVLRLYLQAVLCSADTEVVEGWWRGMNINLLMLIIT